MLQWAVPLSGNYIFGSYGTQLFGLDARSSAWLEDPPWTDPNGERAPILCFIPPFAESAKGGARVAPPKKGLADCPCAGDATPCRS
jgi:hypothetical protein